MTYITKIKKFSVGGCKNRNIWYKKHEVTVTHLLTSNISMRFTKYRHIYKTLLKCMSSIPDIKYIFWKWKKKVYFQFKIKHLRSKLSANSHMNSTFLSYNEYFNNEFITHQRCLAVFHKQISRKKSYPTQVLKQFSQINIP